MTKPLSFVFVFFCFFIGVKSASAAYIYTYTWSGAVDGVTWNNPGNWTWTRTGSGTDTGTYPQSSTDIVIFNNTAPTNQAGSPGAPLTITSSTILIASVTINAGVTVYLSTTGTFSLITSGVAGDGFNISGSLFTDASGSASLNMAGPVNVISGGAITVVPSSTFQVAHLAWGSGVNVYGGSSSLPSTFTCNGVSQIDSLSIAEGGAYGTFTSNNSASEFTAITIGNGGEFANYSSGPQTFRSITVNTGGSFTNESSSVFVDDQVGRVNINGGYFTNNGAVSFGTLTPTNVNSWGSPVVAINAGIFDNNGSVTFYRNSSFSIGAAGIFNNNSSSSAIFNSVDGYPLGNPGLTISGTLNLYNSSSASFAAGSVIFDIASGGVLNIYTTTVVDFEAPLNVKGTLNLGPSAAVSFGFLGGVSTDVPCPIIIDGGAVNLGASSSLTMGGGGSNQVIVLFNGGTITALPGSTITLNADAGGRGASFSGGGTVNATGATFTLSGSDTYIQNSGAFNTTACTFNFSGDNAYLYNDGTFTDSGSTFNFSGALNDTTVDKVRGGDGRSNNVGVALSNDGIFTTRGTTINVSGDNSAYPNNFYVFNTFPGIFILDPTSAINLTGNQSIMANDSGGTFILESSAAGSASIGAISAGSGSVAAQPVQGNYYVQRYIESTTAGYRLLSMPVYAGASTTPATHYSDLTWLNTTPAALDTTLTSAGISGPPFYGAETAGPGGAGSGFSYTLSNPSLSLYDEAITGTSSASAGFYNGNYAGVVNVVSPTAATGLTVNNSHLATNPLSAPLYAGNGLLMYYIGNTNSPNLTGTGTAGATTVTYYGQINQGNIQFYNFFNTNGNLSNANTGLNLVGNPYPSAIDLLQVARDNAPDTTGSSVQFYELSNSAHTFLSYEAVYSGGVWSEMSGGTASEYIASGQGFFVRASASITSLTFKEDQKTTAIAPVGSYLARIPSSVKSDALRNSSEKALQGPKANGLAGLHLMLQADSINFKTCGIYFNSNWTDTFNSYDTKDLDGISPKVYMSSYTSDGARVSINALGSYAKGKNVKLYVKGTTSGAFNLSLTDFANIDTSAFNIILLDHFSNDSFDVVKNKTYNFTINTADTSTFGANRFVLSIVRKSLPPYQLLAFDGSKENTGISINWKTTNEGDYTCFGLQKLNAINKFVTIDSLQSNGSGNYPYFDANPVTGKNIYRLVQNNVDGVTSYSTALVVPFNTTSIGALLSVYPNPAENQVTIDFNGLAPSQTAIYNINIYNSMGASVMQKTTTSNSLVQDVSSLKPGMYMVQILDVNGTTVANAKFIKHQ